MPFRQILQLAEDAVAAFQVEGQRLKAHGIEKDMLATTPDCFLLGHLQQACAPAFMPQYFVNPQDINPQPPPPGEANQAAVQRSIGRAQEKDQALCIIGWRMQEVLGG